MCKRNSTDHGVLGAQRRAEPSLICKGSLHLGSSCYCAVSAQAQAAATQEQRQRELHGGHSWCPILSSPKSPEQGCVSDSKAYPHLNTTLGMGLYLPSTSGWVMPAMVKTSQGAGEERRGHNGTPIK